MRSRLLNCLHPPFHLLQLIVLLHQSCDVSSAPVLSDTHPINPTPSAISPVPLPHMDTNSSVSVNDDDTELFTEEQEKLFSKRFEEGYDLYDPLFVTWLKIRHPYRCVSVTSDVLSECTATTGTCTSVNSCTKTISTVSSSITRSQTETDTLGEILVLPSASRTSKRTKMLNLSIAKLFV